MLSKVLSAATHGVDAYKVEVEADIQQQLPNFITVGLPRRRRERIQRTGHIGD